MQLQALSKSASSSKTPEWIPVSFKLTLDKLDGPPAVGVQARLGRGNQGADKEDAIQRESDDKGLIDFGVVQPGDWGFVLRQAAKDGGNWLLTGTLSVVPGTSITKAIVCPKANEPTAPVSVQVDWPPDMADKGLAVVLCLRHEGFTYQPPLHWHEFHDQDSAGNVGQFHVLCGSEANRVSRLQRGSPGLWQLSERAPVRYSGGSMPDRLEEYKSDQIYVDVALQATAGDPASVQLLHGRNQLLKVAVVRPVKPLAEGYHAERFKVLAYASLKGPAYEQFMELGQLPAGAVSALGIAGTFLLRDFQDITAASSPPTFDVNKNQPNLWTIHLPDELTQAVRVKLMAETKK